MLDIKTHLRGIFKRFMDGLVTEMPPELEDEANYGFIIDQMSRVTGHNPLVIKKELEDWKAIGIGIDTEDPSNIDKLIEHYRERNGLPKTRYFIANRDVSNRPNNQ